MSCFFDETKTGFYKLAVIASLAGGERKLMEIGRLVISLLVCD